MADLLCDLRAGLSPGYNAIVDRDQDPAVGLDFGVHRLAPGEQLELANPGVETALLVIAGDGELSVGDARARFSRPSWIAQGPWVAHGPAGVTFTVAAETACEIAHLATANPEPFAPRLLTPTDVDDEHRGRGQLDDAAYRIVRTAFDRTNAPSAAKLVLGEVVNFPGRWSSYPPHHHAQPEIYYYRFEPAQGYGHGELGERVFMIRQHDLLRITNGRDHAQTAAPGYHMYYLWGIRHLPHDPYTGFTYTPEHAWVLEEHKE